MIKLFQISMNSEGKDRLYFPSFSERDTAFASATSVSLDASNFSRIDDLTFSVDVYSDVLDQYNYAIYNGYHCFILSAVEKTQSSTRLTLKLDVITQYLTGESLSTDKEIFIERTHLDRFVEVGIDEYRYNMLDDDLLVKEDINIEPTIYTDNNFGFTQSLNDTIKWLTITSLYNNSTAETSATTDRIFNDFYFNSVRYQGEVRTPNVTFAVPLIYEDITFKRQDGTTIGTCNIRSIMELAVTTNILDVEVLPYYPSYMIYNYVIDTQNETITVIIDDNYLYAEAGIGTVQRLDTFLDPQNNVTSSYMICNTTFGEFEELKIATGIYTADFYAHKPIFSLQEIVTNADLEPKTLQFKKYDLSFMQQKFYAPFDQFKNDDFVVNIQTGLSYATNRYDFYIRAGNFANLENTGANIVAITDMTIAQNTDQWKEYITQKKVTSSASYAYLGQVAQGAIGAGSQLAIGNQVGAVGQIGATVGNVAQTYAQRQDLKQAPATVRSRGGNVLSDFPYGETFYLSATEITPTDTEMKFIINRLRYDGYLLNDYRNLYDIIDTRENFNYIQTRNNDMILKATFATSEVIMQEINKLLNNGLRFYKSIEKINTKSLINTERSL